MPELIEVVFNLPVNRRFTYAVPAGEAAEVGVRVMAPFGSRSLVGFVVGTASEPPEGVTQIKEFRRRIDARPLFDRRLLELAGWLSGLYLCSLGEALSAMLPGGRREVAGDEPGVEPPAARELSLSAAQRLAIESIGKAEQGLFYLYGVTGSGKTEVFLQVAAAVLARGRGVIYLVPEISLTHQVVEQFAARFGPTVAVLHSGLTPSQRLQEWLRVADRQARLVIGARSAVFAPVPELGLIVIDEEHEGSYKSGTTPRYHARQVAMHRAKAERAALVMGSATPSLEAWQAMRAGRITAFELPERLSGGRLPEVRIQDLNGESVPLSRPLMREIRRTHEAGRQTILFLNRRGFAYFFHCRSCGYEMKCRNCSVSLTYHKQRNRMVCHYCGYRIEPVAVCPECGSMDVGYTGFGTERIEEELARLFPELTVRRIDTDAVRRGRSLRAVLEEFRSGKIDILLGTQMVAKGLNFPGVKLVGIVSADTGLRLPDFRAAERTFDLIVQVSGRAGRFHPDGTVIVQTYLPRNETIRLAAKGDLEEFFRRELEVRRELGFPPFTRLIRLVFRSRSAAKSLAAAKQFARRVPAQESGPGAVEVLGPAECPLAVMSGNTRTQVLLRSVDFRRLHAAARAALEGLDVPGGVYVEVDVDPVSLL
jgi:primosomal protein N' (replication factor Y)